MIAIVTGWILFVLGVLLAAGGVWLAALGGSWAYIGLGIGWLLCGALLIARRRAALGVYALLLLCTVIWAVWEAGLDRWALVPRLALFWLVGLWLLTAWVSRSLGMARAPRHIDPARDARGVPLQGAPTRNVPSADSRNPPPRETPRPEPSVRYTTTSDGVVVDERNVPAKRVYVAPRRWYAARDWLAAAALLLLIVGLVSMTRDPFDIAGQVPAAVGAATARGALPADDWPVYGGNGYG